MKDHTKSRRGCHQCKQRKVKCDETLPCCKRCHRRRETCSYLREFGPGGSYTDGYIDHHLYPGSSHSVSSQGSPSVIEPPMYPIDLELTHFYLVHTYKTLWGREEARLVWRDTIFPNSIHHPPLRDGIFAMAAMHRLMTSEDLTPEQRSIYRSTALRKQTSALRGFVPLLQAIDDTSAEVALPMSILVAHWAFASRSLPPELNILSMMDIAPSFDPVPSFAMGSALNQFLELLRRVQPIHHVIDQARPTLLTGRLATLMAAPKPDELPALSEDTQKALGSLRGHLDVVPDVKSFFRDQDPIDSLDHMFRLSLRPEWGELMVGWVVRVPEKFVSGLRNGDHAAMTILAYWAASFYPVNERWWAKGWSVALILEVWSAVAEPWKGLVGWASQYAGVAAC